jgi:hypothetical protein
MIRGNSKTLCLIWIRSHTGWNRHIDQHGYAIEYSSLLKSCLVFETGNDEKSV